MKTITYRRTGRKLRSSGSIIDRSPAGLVKVKPDRHQWRAIWITDDEIEAGEGKAPQKPRQRVEGQKRQPRKPRAPKAQPAPAWKQALVEIRNLADDHSPDSWPPIKMAALNALADEVEAAHRKLETYLI